MSKYNGLKRRFHNAIKNELKRLELPEPASDYGFTEQQLLDNLSKSEYNKFCKWMCGQTMMVDKEGRPIVYVEDVLRGVRLIRYGTPTYFD